MHGTPETDRAYLNNNLVNYKKKAGENIKSILEEEEEEEEGEEEDEVEEEEVKKATYIHSV